MVSKNISKLLLILSIFSVGASLIFYMLSFSNPNFLSFMFLSITSLGVGTASMAPIASVNSLKRYRTVIALLLILASSLALNSVIEPPTTQETSHGFENEKIVNLQSFALSSNTLYPYAWSSIQLIHSANYSVSRLVVVSDIDPELGIKASSPGTWQGIIYLFLEFNPYYAYALYQFPIMFNWNSTEVNLDLGGLIGEWGNGHTRFDGYKFDFEVRLEPNYSASAYIPPNLNFTINPRIRFFIHESVVASNIQNDLAIALPATILGVNAYVLSEDTIGYTKKYRHPIRTEPRTSDAGGI